jgi:hypothetical protein
MKQLGRHRHRWEDNIKMGLREDKFKEDEIGSVCSINEGEEE